MAAAEEDTLQSLLNKATSPLNREDDFDCITLFCRKINEEEEGAVTSTRLLAHKIQSPQEHEALQALVVLEHCMKSCGKDFQNEVGKYRFLNELIKVVSPKYLGHKTTDKVKNKVIQLMYVWSIALIDQIKIRDAYQMLKQQGIVTADPEYDDMMLIPTPPPRDDKNNLFKDEERQKRLEKLLKSKNPEDLQAANRLIKSVVMEDQNRMEKVEKRCKMIEEVNNNVRLLSEMLAHFDAKTTPASDVSMMKELHSGCLKLRPGLFRLASDTDDDELALMDILKANDDLSRVIQSYEKLVLSRMDMDRKGDGEESKKPEETGGIPKSSLIDLAELEFNAAALSGGSNDANRLSADINRPAVTNGDLFQIDATPAVSSSDDLSSIFAAASITSQSRVMNPMQQPPVMMSQHQPVVTQQLSSKKPTNTVPPLLPPPSSGSNKPKLSEIDFLSRDLLEKTLGRKPGEKFQPKPAGKPTLNQLSSKQTANNSQQAAASPQVQATVAPSTNTTDLLSDIFSPLSTGGVTSSTPNESTGVTIDEPEPFADFLSSPVATPQTTSPLDMPLTTTPVVTSSPPVANQMSEPVVASATTPAPLLPLTDVNVALESIKPSTLPPLTVYDRNGLRVLFHFAQDFATPDRTDTLVTVVSIMSTRPAPIPHIVLQVAVPKIMRVKLQPPSSTQLGAFNPIVPTSPITQVMILANPNKKEVKMRYKFDYKLDEQTSVSDTGEVTGFPAFEKWGAL